MIPWWQPVGLELGGTAAVQKCAMVLARGKPAWPAEHMCSTTPRQPELAAAVAAAAVGCQQCCRARCRPLAVRVDAICCCSDGPAVREWTPEALIAVPGVAMRSGRVKGLPGCALPRWQRRRHAPATQITESLCMVGCQALRPGALPISHSQLFQRPTRRDPGLGVPLLGCPPFCARG